METLNYTTEYNELLSFFRAKDCDKLRPAEDADQLFADLRLRGEGHRLLVLHLIWEREPLDGPAIGDQVIGAKYKFLDSQEHVALEKVLEIIAKAKKFEKRPVQIRHDCQCWVVKSTLESGVKQWISNMPILLQD